METTTMLPYTRVKTYDLKRNVDQTFSTEADARKWIAEVGTACFNIYRIEKVNGTWRTDWQMKNVAY